MSTFTYKVSYLNDPLNKFMQDKEEKTESSVEIKKPDFLNPNTIKNMKKDRRTTKLLLDVNEFGIFSTIDANIPNTNSNGLLTPPSDNEEDYLSAYRVTNINNNTTSTTTTTTTTNNNGLLAPPTQKNSSLSLPKQSLDTTKAKKHSSFINPLMDMKFDVGGLFDDDGKNGDDLFGAMLSKFDSLSSELDNEDDNESIKRKHISTGTIKAGNESEDSFGTIKRDSQDTIKFGMENNHNEEEIIDNFDNELVQNLNDKPTIVIDNTFLNSSQDEQEEGEDVNRGFNPDVYKDDYKVDYTSNDWSNPWSHDQNKKVPESIKSSQSKKSTFSSFTIKSSKKLTSVTKKFYKKLTKSKESSHFPSSPIDIPASYNEKERAFEEMILRDDTISLSLSNPNGALTSTFADKTFPLGEDVNDNLNENTFDYESSFYGEKSIISSGSDEDIYTKKKRHRNGINFEEALKQGNNFRISLANM